MKIEVIIPVINCDMADALLNQIDFNTIKPSRVIVIDNTSRGYHWRVSEDFDLNICYSKTGLVNESWELGRSKVSQDTYCIAILNDDLIIGDWFFERILDTFESNNECAIACPNTVDKITKVEEGPVEYRFDGNKRMPGWAYVIRKDVFDQVPPIPYDRITTFCGDSWYWGHIKRMGYVWGKDLGNNIYHYVGTSVLPLGFRNIKKKERNEWLKIKHETWRDK